MEKYNHSSYIFSNESIGDLLEFYRTSKQFANEGDPQQKKIWKQILPPNHQLIEKLEKNLESEKKAVIDLTNSEEILPLSQNNIGQEQEDGISELNEIKSFLSDGADEKLTTVDDIVFSVKENLESSGQISNEVIKQMKLYCTLAQLEDIFKSFEEVLQTEDVYKFGMSILSATCEEKFQIASYYCKYILLSKLSSTQTEQLTTLLKQFLENFKQIISDHIIQQLITQSVNKSFQDNLMNIDKEHRNYLMRHFIFNCSKLEPHHFPLIENAIDILDKESLKKLVELMSSASNNYSSDKTFGKLLIGLLKNGGRDLGYFEHQLKYIVTNHKSIWKGQAMKLIEKISADVMNMSLSFKH